MTMDHLQVVATSLACWWVFAAFVGGMPDPRPDSFGYLWLYRSLHLLAANIAKARGEEPTFKTVTTTVEQTTPMRAGGQMVTTTESVQKDIPVAVVEKPK